jgi:hypothetical protein
VYRTGFGANITIACFNDRMKKLSVCAMAAPQSLQLFKQVRLTYTPEVCMVKMEQDLNDLPLSQSNGPFAMDTNIQTESKSALRPSKRVFTLTLILASIIPPIVISVAGTFLTHKPESLYVSWTLPNDQAVYAGSAFSGMAIALLLLIRAALRWRAKESVFGVTIQDIRAVAFMWLLATAAAFCALICYVPWDFHWPWMN